MIAMLLWIVGCYGVAVATVHLMHHLHNKLRGDKPVPWMHVIVATHNDERHMEWIVRAYCWFAWLKGRRLHLTMVDSGSIDATIDIVWRIARRYDVTCDMMNVSSVKEQMEVVALLEKKRQVEELQVVLYLKRKEDWRKVPFMVGSSL
ncbi:hypothetical protein [Paenibacillus taiwanensis]|uniref:hypothetical protein n=1 Tax=Paenibacillus taiwanensis TaxID=401638 RepID=UPI0003FE3AA7|nr:hypothetical protein [Paenibacillus taiwanensis]